MKRIFALLVSIFYIMIFTSVICAWYIFPNKGESISGYQSLSPGKFFMYYKWFCGDSAIFSLNRLTISTGDSDNYTEISNNYFDEFDYEPIVDLQLLKLLHNQNTFSIYDEGDAIFQVEHNDLYDNPPRDGYPQLLLTFPDGSTQTYTMHKNSVTNNIYTYSLSLGKGSYDYKYMTTNKHYEQGFYEISGHWHVTTKPYNFVKENPVSFVEVLPDNTYFSWTISTDETNDALSYELYIGLSPEKSKLRKFEANPETNSLSFTISKLNHKRKYYWYMVVKNKFGAMIETEMYSFITGGMVEKFYNAPNPFNPAKGVKTDFVFPMYQDGTAQITVYSEYGDKVWESESLFFSGNNSQTIRYDGKDNSGKMLYNGTYLAILTKKYSNKTETERCRILIIK